jgi:hypothetical protein
MKIKVPKTTINNSETSEIDVEFPFYIKDVDFNVFDIYIKVNQDLTYLEIIRERNWSVEIFQGKKYQFHLETFEQNKKKQSANKNKFNWILDKTLKILESAKDVNEN